MILCKKMEFKKPLNIYKFNENMVLQGKHCVAYIKHSIQISSRSTEKKKVWLPYTNSYTYLVFILHFFL